MADSIATFDKAVAFAGKIRAEAESRHGTDGAVIAAKSLVADAPELVDHNLSILIERPENPRAAWQTLAEIAQIYLRDGRSMPQNLANWTARQLAAFAVGETPRPALGRIGKAAQDTAIAAAIFAVNDRFGIPVSRNAASEPYSAADAAAEAWGVSYKKAEAAWHNRPPVLRPPS